MMHNRHRMRSWVRTALVLVMLFQFPGGTPVLTQTPTTPEQTTPSQVAAAYVTLPLSFEANQGLSADNRVKFLSRGSGYSLHLTTTEVVLTLPQPTAVGQDRLLRGTGRLDLGKVLEGWNRTNGNSAAVVRISLVGANSKAAVTGRDEQSSNRHSFIGSDPSNWRTNIPHYARVEYQQVYPGVDLVYYGNQRQLEYDFVVSPGADPNIIRLAFDGVDRLDVDDQGDLVLRVGSGDIRQHKPFAYQDIDGVRREIRSSYLVREQDQISFQVGDYDPTRPLVIDPVLSFSTYLGGPGHDLGFAIAEASSFFSSDSGLTFVAGVTGGNDVFVTSLDFRQQPGLEEIYTVTFGGAATDIGNGVAVDRQGFAYVTGTTDSSDFPMTETPFPVDFGGGLDAFVAVLDPGGWLHYSAYFGGSGDDRGHGIAVNQDCMASPGCQVYVTGDTNSAADTFPTVNPVQPTFAGGLSDVFVAKLDLQLVGTGNEVVYSTYLGGENTDIGSDIAVKPDCILDCDVYVTGHTDSIADIFVTGNPAQPLFGGGVSDAFVAKFNAAGVVSYSTYLGGQFADRGTGIAADAVGHAYVTGWSEEPASFPGVPLLTATGDRFFDAFVVKLGIGGNYIYGALFGSSGEDRGSDIALEPDCQSDCDAYVAGVTRPEPSVPPDFPTVHPVQPEFGGGASDAFVVRLNWAGNDLIYSTYLGGSDDEFNLGREFSVGPSIAVDIDGNAYVAGFTLSTDFPTVNPLQAGNLGSNDAFVATLDATGPPVADAGPDQEVQATNEVGAEVTLDGTGSTDPDGDELAFWWALPLGDPLTGPTPTFLFPVGETTVELTVDDGTGGTDTDTVVITVTEPPNAEPVAEAGPVQTVTCTVQQGDAEECLVQLDGAGSSDPDDDPLTYHWELTLGDGLRSATGATPIMSVPAGLHRIDLTVDDGRGGQAVDHVEVTVMINHPPVGEPHPLEQVFECNGPDGAAVTLDASGFSDPDGDELTYSWVVVELEGEGSVVHTTAEITSVVFLSLGAYQVTLTVDDGRGGVVTEAGLASVVDTMPPTLDVSLSPNVILENNHQMVLVGAMIQVSDQCDAGSTVTLVSATSNEPDNGTGDGDTPNDIQGADPGQDDRSFSVRAERRGSGSGRVYTITYAATDASGNSTETSPTVTVPHNQSGS